MKCNYQLHIVYIVVFFVTIMKLMEEMLVFIFTGKFMMYLKTMIYFGLFRTKRTLILFIYQAAILKFCIKVHISTLEI